MTTVRVSKRPEESRHATRTVAALQRARDRGRPRAPGQRVGYVVVDDDRRDRERVRLVDAEDPDRVDPDHYCERLLRAAASVLAPCGWSAGHVRRALATHEDAPLDAY